MPRYAITTPGSNTWPVPDDCWSVVVYGIGGGGSGGGSTSADGGTGGGGGAFAIATIPVTPGADISYQVGSGGAARTGGNPGFAGTNTWFSNTSLMLAVAGSGGTFNGTTGGAGGSSASSRGWLTTSGGAGGGGVSGGDYGSGGGGAGGFNNGTGAGAANATTASAGGAGSGGSAGGTSGGTTASGGAGANGTTFTSTFPTTQTTGSGGGGGGSGRNTGVTGGAGGLYGAGGGGAGRDGTSSGAGANGVLVLNYTPYNGRVVFCSYDSNSEITVSNNNLTVSANATVKSIRTNKPFANTAKIYFEMRLDASSGSGGGPAIATSLAGLTDDLGNTTESVAAWDDGSLYTNIIATTVYGASVSAGDIIRIAYNPITGKIWAALNGGNWNNSGTANPANNNGGFTFTVAGATHYYIACTPGPKTWTGLLSPQNWVYGTPYGFNSVDDVIENEIVFTPNDKNTGITLRDFNLTVAGSGTGFQSRGARCLFPLNGKNYWEVQVSTTSNNSDFATGIGNLNQSIDTFPNSLTHAYAVQTTTNTTPWTFAEASDGDPFVAGDTSGIICFAADSVNKKIWWRSGSEPQWLPSGDPALGTGGDTYTANGYMYPMIYAGSAGGNATAKFDGSSWTYDPPAGFKQITPNTNGLISYWGVPVISNNNISITGNSANGDNGARSVWAKYKGKYYWEVKVDQKDTAGYGIGAGRTFFTPYAGYFLNGDNNTRGQFSHLTDPFGMPTFDDGDVISVALDIDNSYMWMRKNDGPWYGSNSVGVPDTGYNPLLVDFSGSGPISAYVNMGNNAFDRGTVRFTEDLWTYNPPKGFVAPVQSDDYDYGESSLLTSSQYSNKRMYRNDQHNFNGFNLFTPPIGTSRRELGETISVSVRAPVSGDTRTMFYTEKDLTLTSTRSVVWRADGTGTTPYSLHRGLSRAGTSNVEIRASVTEANITTGTTNTSFSNNSVPAGSFVWASINFSNFPSDELNITFNFADSLTSPSPGRRLAATAREITTQMFKTVSIKNPYVTQTQTYMLADEYLNIKKIMAVVRGTSPSVTFSVKKSADRYGTNAVTIIDKMVCNNTTEGIFRSNLTDSDIFRGEYVWVEINAASGTINEFFSQLFF